jgi:hypothetical protein
VCACVTHTALVGFGVVGHALIVGHSVILYPVATRCKLRGQPSNRYI